jgi:hypothetical protein
MILRLLSWGALCVTLAVAALGDHGLARSSADWRRARMIWARAIVAVLALAACDAAVLTGAQ